MKRFLLPKGEVLGKRRKDTMVRYTDVSSTHAYIKATVEPSQTRQVMQELRAIPGTGAHEVLGSYGS